MLSTMDPAEAKACMKRCVDSGLWVAKDSSVFEEGENDDEELSAQEGEGDSAGDK